ncbi:rRNA-processing protein utp21 [Gurleya vavrai]
MSLFSYSHTINQLPSATPLFINNLIALTTSHSYKLYDPAKLNIVFNGPLLPDIKLLKFNEKYLVAMTNKKIVLTYRSEIVDEIVIKALGFEMIGNRIFIWQEYKIFEYEINETKNELNQYKEIFNFKYINSIEKEHKISFVLHPNTYINKIVIAYENGFLEIYNYHKNKKIYQTINLNNKITFLEQSPIIDVIAVALENKEIVMFNLKTDKILFTLKCEETIKTISFRTDNEPFMVIISENKNLFYYHLEERRCVTKLENILNAVFIHNEPLITITTENSIKIMKIDGFNFVNLKERKFMNENIVKADFYENNLIAVGNNEINSLNLMKEELNFKFSIKNYNKGEDLSIQNNKILVNSKEGVFLFDFFNKRGKKIIESFDDSIKKSVISSCGNFAAFCSENEINIVNLHSKLIYKKIEFEEIQRNINDKILINEQTNKNNCDNLNILKNEEAYKKNIDNINNIIFKNEEAKNKNFIDNDKEKNLNCFENAKKICLNDKEMHNIKSVLCIELDLFKKQLLIVTKKYLLLFDKDFKMKSINLHYEILNSKIINNFCFLQTEKKILMYDYDRNIISREFLITNVLDFCLSNDFKLLIANQNEKLFVFDILSSRIINEIENKSKLVKIAPNDDFLCAVKEKEINCFFNNSFFDEFLIKKLIINTEKNDEKNYLLENKKIEKNQILIIEEFNKLGKNQFENYIANLEIEKIIEILKGFEICIRNYFTEIQEILFFILRIHKNKINLNDILEFYNSFMEVFNKIGNNFEKTLGYIEFEKRNIIY